MFSGIPKPVRVFLLRALIFFAAWKIIYILILVPREIPDAWLVKRLGEHTASVLSICYPNQSFEARHIRKIKQYGNDHVWVTHSFVYKKNVRYVLGIYQACDGLELMILTVGFFLCFMGGWQLKLIYSLVSVTGLYMLNVARCSMLGVVNLTYPQHFEFAHKYLFNLIVYAFTFLMWMNYVQRVKKTFLKKEG